MTYLRNTLLPVVAIAVLIAVSTPSLQNLFAYSSAVSPADKKAIEWINKSDGESFATTENVAWWIYSISVKQQYVKTEADFVVWRNTPMTPRSDPSNIYFTGDNASLEGLSVLQSFVYKDIEVRIYGKGS